MKARVLIITCTGAACFTVVAASILVFLWYLFTVTFLK